MKKIMLIASVLFVTMTVSGQTAEEIISKYLEVIGGEEKLKAVTGIKMTGAVNQGGMEIAIEIVELKTGKQYLAYTLQGKTIKETVYDGETLWGTNFMTMKAEKKDAESTENFKLDINDFLDDFLDYQKKGYAVELLGKELVEGTEAFKIKLTKEPIKVEGKEEESVAFYFFDIDNFIPIAVHEEIRTGQMKGAIGETTFSDYQEIEGIYFPFSIGQGIKGKESSSPLTISSIELNPTIEDASFLFPKETETQK